MKRWWKFLIIFWLGIVLILLLNQSLMAQQCDRKNCRLDNISENKGLIQAQILPSQLVRQAQKLYQMGEFKRSLQLLEQANQLYQGETKYLQQAQIYSLMSLAQQQLDNWDLAENKIVDSFALLEKTAPSSSKNQVLAQIWHTKGHFEFGRGKNRQALEDWKKAEQLYRLIEDRLGVSGSLLNQAKALEKMGFYPRSCDRILAAFERQKNDCDNLTLAEIEKIISRVKIEAQPWQIEGLNQLSNILLLKGKLSQAETIITANQAINSSLPYISPLAEAKVLLSLGNVNKAIAFQAKEFEDLPSFLSHVKIATEYYQQLNSEGLHPQIADKYKFSAQLNLLSLFVSTQQWFKAQNLVSQIGLHSKNPSQKRNLYAEIKFALDLQRLKQNGVAIEYSWQNIADIYLDVIQQAKTTENFSAQSYALGYLGMLQMRHVNLELENTPQELISQALNLAQQVQASEIAYRWQWQLGKIYADQNQREFAIASYQASLMTLDSLREDLASLTREIQFDFHEQIEPIYKEYADLLLTGTSPSNMDLVNALDAIESLQIAELDNYFQDACLTSKVRNINQIDKNAVAIHTLILPNSLEVIMAMNNPDGTTSTQTFRHHRELIAQKDLETIVQQLRLYITEPDRTVEVKKLSAQLYDMLIKPFEPDLINRQPSNLVFVLDGILQTVPMSILYDGEKYLLEKYAIALTPGLRMLNLQNPTDKLSF